MDFFGRLLGYGQAPRSGGADPYGVTPGPGPKLGPSVPGRLMGRGGSSDPYGMTPRPGAWSAPTGSAGPKLGPPVPGRLMGRGGSADPYGVTPRSGTSAPAPAPRPAPRAPAYERPAAPARSDFAQDYRVPPGSTPMPQAAPSLPQGSTASRSNAVMAPLGASRNSDLVQAAGNAGLRLIDPAWAGMFEKMAPLPGSSEDGARRMLSEFGDHRPAIMGDLNISPAAFDPAGALSPAALQASQAGFQVAAPSGDRFAHLRPDLAEWARHHENSAKGVDGLNIVDRFMAKQGAAPPAPPAAMPQTTAVDTARAFAPQPEVDQAMALATSGADIGLSPEMQSQISRSLGQAPQGAFAQPAAPAFDMQANLIDQVQLLREMYRNNSRPNPGTAGVRP